MDESRKAVLRSLADGRGGSGAYIEVKMQEGVAEISAESYHLPVDMARFH